VEIFSREWMAMRDSDFVLEEMTELNYNR